MRRASFLVMALALAAKALAQGGAGVSPGAGSVPPPYQPAVPPPSTVMPYAGYEGYSGASTAAGSALNGMAGVISAAGEYNLATSAAAVNMTQAQRQHIINRQSATNAYFEMRATNRAARAAEAEPRPKMEDLVRIAQQGVPKTLSTSALDPVSGKISWPELLQTDPFAAPRVELDRLFAKRATYGGLDFAEQGKARQAVDTMSASLRAIVADVPPMTYTASKSFLNSLAALACKCWAD